MPRVLWLAAVGVVSTFLSSRGPDFDKVSQYSLASSITLDHTPAFPAHPHCLRVNPHRARPLGPHIRAIITPLTLSIPALTSISRRLKRLTRMRLMSRPSSPLARDANSRSLPFVRPSSSLSFRSDISSSSGYPASPRYLPSTLMQRLPAMGEWVVCTRGDEC